MTYPNLKQSIWLLILLLLITLGLGILTSHIDKSLIKNNYLKGLLMLTGLILILCYVSRRADRTWKDMLPLAIRDIDYNWRVWLSVGLSIFGLWLITFQLTAVVEHVIPLPEKFQRAYDALVDANKISDLLSLVFLVVLIGPFVEEVLCRGIILRGLLAHYTQNRAIFWSAILFAASHLNPWQFLVAFILGIVFAWWVIQTGSLWPAILGHALNNFFSVTFTHFEIPGFPVSEDLNVIIHNPWWLNVCGPILAVLGLWWFYRVAKQKEAEARKDTG